MPCICVQYFDDTIRYGEGVDPMLFYGAMSSLYYNFSLSFSLFTAAELGPKSFKIFSLSIDIVSDSIEKISTDNYGFMFLTTSTDTNSKSTDLTGFANVEGLVQVFNYDITYGAGNDGWLEVPLDVPFEYDGVKSLVIVWVSNDGSFVTDGDITLPTLKFTTLTSNKFAWAQRDGSLGFMPLEIHSSPVITTPDFGRPNFRFLVI